MRTNPATPAEVDSWLTVLHQRRPPPPRRIRPRQHLDRAAKPAQPPLDPAPPGPGHGLDRGSRPRHPPAGRGDGPVTANDPAATTPGQQREPTTAPGGASCRVRRSYGPSYALAPAQEGGGSPAGPRARAHGDQPDSGTRGRRSPGEKQTTAPRASSRARARPRSPTARRAAAPATRASAPTRRPPACPTPRRPRSPPPPRSAPSPSPASSPPPASPPPAVATTVHTNEQLDAAIDELAALRTALSRVGNNINQIAFVLQRRRPAPPRRTRPRPAPP